MTAQTEQTKRPGRRPGWSPGETRKMTHQVGAWMWNHATLLSKLVKGVGEDDCWQFTGSRGPQGNLFGAYKNGRAQMTQANRLLAMATSGEDLEGQCVFMRCGNRYCSNPQHFVIQPKKGASVRDIYV
jgi:hypothetical protein